MVPLNTHYRIVSYRFRSIDGSKKHGGPLAKMHNLWAPYNSNAHEPNFTKRGCDGSLDIVVKTVVLVSRRKPAHFLQFYSSGTILRVLFYFTYFADPSRLLLINTSAVQARSAFNGRHWLKYTTVQWYKPQTVV